jgi:DNA-damage-inducible protein J
VSETTFTFRVDSDLKERFAEAAKEHDRVGSQLLRDFMRSFITQRTDTAAYETWFRQQVQGALDDPRPPLPSRTVEQHFAKRRAAARRKAGARKR